MRTYTYAQHFPLKHLYLSVSVLVKNNALGIPKGDACYQRDARIKTNDTKQLDSELARLSTHGAQETVNGKQDSELARLSTHGAQETVNLQNPYGVLPKPLRCFTKRGTVFCLNPYGVCLKHIPLKDTFVQNYKLISISLVVS